MIIYCDGGSRGNPGNAASAFVVIQNDIVVYKQSKYLGIETNNVAEYTAVLLALNWIIKNPTKENIIFNLDSQLVERQLNGFYKIKNERLKILNADVKDKLKIVKKNIEFKWNYRTSNKLADDLVNEELDRS